MDSRLLCSWYFPGKNTRVGYHLSPGHLPDPGIEPVSLQVYRITVYTVFFSSVCSCMCVLIDFFFFLGTQQNSVENRVPKYSLSPHMYSLPHTSKTPFVTAKEPPLTHHYCPESTVYIKLVLSWYCLFCGLDKCIVT